MSYTNKLDSIIKITCILSDAENIVWRIVHDTIYRYHVKNFQAIVSYFTDKTILEEELKSLENLYDTLIIKYKDHTKNVIKKDG
jgi:hypothetical protein